MKYLVLTALILGACTASQTATTAQDVQLACMAATIAANDARGASLLKGGASNTVNDVAVYVDAACPVINGAVTVAANVAANPTSTAWLNSLSASLAAMNTTHKG